MTLMDQNLIYRTNITDANEQGGKIHIDICFTCSSVVTLRYLKNIFVLAFMSPILIS